MSFSITKDQDDLLVNVPGAYSLNVVKEAIYSLAKKYNSVIEQTVPNVILRVLDYTDVETVRETLPVALNDFLLREKIDLETRNIKELIIAKAFSMGEYDEEPYGDALDPVKEKY